MCGKCPACGNYERMGDNLPELPISNFFGNQFRKGDTTKLKKILDDYKNKINSVMKEHLDAEKRHEQFIERERRERDASRLGNHILEKLPNMSISEINEKLGIKEDEESNEEDN